MKNDVRGKNILQAVVLAVTVAVTGLYIYAAAAGVLPSIPDAKEFRAVYGTQSEVQ